MEFRLIRHGLVDSTSERAFAAIVAGEARHGDVHLAEGQTRGRGRRGRSWVSEPGEGLFLSLVLLPDPPPLKPVAVTVATALAVLESVIDLGLPSSGARSPRLKWPNDVLAGGAKLCGILTESRSLVPVQNPPQPPNGPDRAGPQGGGGGFCPGTVSRPPHFVVGIGLNVSQRHFPDELVRERAVTSLALLGREVGVETVTAAVLGRLQERLAQVRNRHRRLAGDFLRASGLAGRPVRVRSGRNETIGTVLDLTLSGGLEIRNELGTTEVLPLEFVSAVELLDEA